LRIFPSFGARCQLTSQFERYLEKKVPRKPFRLSRTQSKGTFTANHKTRNETTAIKRHDNRSAILIIMTTTAPNDKSSHNHHHKKDQRRAKRKRNQRKPVVQSLNTMKHYDDDDVNNEHQQNYTSQEEHYALKSRTSNTLDNELSNALLPAGGGGGDDERVHHETNAPNKRINPTISQAPSTPTTTTAATPSTATTTWDSVFRQAALVEPLGGDLDHDETFRPPAPVVHSGLSQIAQLLLSPSDPPPVFLPVGGNDEEEEEPKITTSANPSADAAVARATTAAKHSPLRETKKRKKRKRSQNKDQPPPQQPLMLQDLHKLVKQEDALKSEPSQCDDDDDDDELVNEPSSCLEGHLVPSTDDASANRMVLVDRQKGTVYSSTQRDDTTGDLIQIGEWNEGKVTLWPQQEPSPHDHVVTSATSSTTITGTTLDGFVARLNYCSLLVVFVKTRDFPQAYIEAGCS
jgi:hypothetical protein